MATAAALSSCALPEAETRATSQQDRIAFITHNVATPRDYVVVSMNEDGSDLVELGPWSYTAHIDFRQCWSLDGKRLVHIGGARADPTRWLSVVDADWGSHRLMEITDIRGLSISPDGQTVLMARQERRVIEIAHEGHIDLETEYPTNIIAVDVESGEMKALTDFTDIQAESPVFSPDRKKIAFIGRTDDPQTHFDVYVMNADGSGLRRLTHNHGFISFYQGLQWSPDSRKILYGLETLMLSDIDHYDDIFVLDVASGQSINLTNTPEIDDAYFSWSPDGKKIAFMSTRELRPGISDTGVYVMGAEGENVTEVPALEGRPAWLPDSRTLIATGRAQDGTLAMVAVDVESGDFKLLIPYTSISGNYSGMSDAVWLGN